MSDVCGGCTAPHAPGIEPWCVWCLKDVENANPKERCRCLQNVIKGEWK